MSERFVISDTHFGHEKCCTVFKREDGSPLRPFANADEMNEAMVERWNAKVKPEDKVYHLGDVAIGKKNVEFVKRLNGKKRLIMGNHEHYGNDIYREVGFERLEGMQVFGKFILTHIPLHPDCVERFGVNVHGHLHDKEIMTMATIGPGATDVTYTNEPDPRYLCVSVEHTNYEPISFDEVEARIKARWEARGYNPASKAWGNGQGPN